MASTVIGAGITIEGWVNPRSLRAQLGAIATKWSQVFQDTADSDSYGLWLIQNGTDVNLLRSAVFDIGCGLAGIGGVLAAPLVTASVGMAATMIIDAFVIVIIGGMGSFLGSLIAALLVAFTQVFGEYYLPDLALAFMYLLMLLVLVVRPGGLLGKEA